MTNITTLDFDKITTFPTIPILEREINCCLEIEQELVNQSGELLLGFCKNFSDPLVRMFLAEDDVDTISLHLAEALSCDVKQAHCLIELTLILVHAKAEGGLAARHSLDLSYLISMAASALNIQMQ